MTWDPKQYQRFGDERSRPFHELVQRINAGPKDLKQIVDLGCGPGNLTATLTERWPIAKVIGVDNDANMLATAQSLASPQLNFVSGDLAAWRPAEPTNAIISNAAYQWVPDHLPVVSKHLDFLEPGGWLAFQVPGNLDDLHHQAIRSLYRSPRWSKHSALAELPDRTHSSHSAVAYLDTLAGQCAQIDAWETTYVHVLQGSDPVLEWVKGTALRPILSLLPDETSRNEFLDELGSQLRDLYPAKAWGTPFPFKRVFVVGQRR